MTKTQVLQKAIAKQCLQCGAAMVKKPKQSYAQWERQKYCTVVCGASVPRKTTSDATNNASFHRFWRSRIPEPKACELCRQPGKLALSNRSQQYLNVITDWWYLCYPCHGRYDATGIRIWSHRYKAYGHNFKTIPGRRRSTKYLEDNISENA